MKIYLLMFQLILLKQGRCPTTHQVFDNEACLRCTIRSKILSKIKMSGFVVGQCTFTWFCDCLYDVHSKAFYEVEQKLVDNLFNNGTHPDVLPMVKGPVNVTFGLTLNQIVDVDEKQQILTTSAWVRQAWKNPSMSWNPADYMNITEINILPSRVWKPDVVLYDSVSDSGGGGHLDQAKTRIIVNASGYHRWFSPINLRSHCKIDVKKFPFDEQSCVVKFGSWTYDGTRLDIIPEATSADISSFKANTEWCLISFPVKKNVLKYACCDEPYVDLTFTLSIERKPLFYIFNLILPCVCITALTILSFCLPPESGERVSLSITIILAMTVFMFIVADKVPPNSDSLPLIGIFYFACMVEETLGLIAVCYTLSLYYTNPQWYKMPSWVRWLVADWSGKLLGIHLDIPRRHSLGNLDSIRHSVLEKAQLTRHVHESSASSELDSGNIDTITSNGHTPNKRFRVSRGDRGEGSPEENRHLDYWKLAAMITDRIMFIIFFITILVTFIVMFSTVSQRCQN